MIQLLGAVLVAVAALALTAALLRRADRGRDRGAAVLWVNLHHVAVAVLAVSVVVAFATPPDALGTAHPSDPFGGYVGRYAFGSTVLTVLMLPVTAVARLVATRATSDRTRTVTATTAWVLLLGGATLLAALML